ncbi:hypothetical protein RB195_024134 [Necator americanus]|uniref:Uncharacterized protein n=1 Tax=Necator americanus TaxID=51031 RepID=A0ABR1ELZ1_NECAM
MSRGMQSRLIAPQWSSYDDTLSFALIFDQAVASPMMGAGQEQFDGCKVAQYQSPHTGNGKEGPRDGPRILRECLRGITRPVDMPADKRTYLDEVTLQSFMKMQTTVLDVLLATETQKTAQLQGNIQRRVV